MSIWKFILNDTKLHQENYRLNNTVIQATQSFCSLGVLIFGFYEF